MQTSLYIKRKIYNNIQAIFKWWYGEFPIYELESKHIEGCKVLTNRKELLAHLPKGRIFAEIGVEHGVFAENILEICEPLILHLVDWWPSIKDLELTQKRLNQFENILYFRKKSVDYLESQNENSIDIIYLDTDHTYLTTKEELIRAHRVVRKSGFICGHDYTSVDYYGVKKYGVVEAVNEFCVVNGYKFVYLTHETKRYISYALKKLED